MLKGLIICLLFACSAAQEPYCIRNETIHKKMAVHKTRQVAKKDWKIWKKPRMEIEYYIDYEEHFEVKPISECCPGYHMTELRLCEPTCPLGCPAYASCEAPNKCHCKLGYIQAISHHDGRPYCEPMCPNECPSGTICKEPNKCECKDGYHAMDDGSGRCVPQCTSGDGCQHGRCVDVDECICDNGYNWDEPSARCIVNHDAAIYTTSRSMEQRQADDVTDEAEIDSDEDIIDNYVTEHAFKINFDATTTSESSLTTVRVLTECPEGFILYKGECRAEDFTYEAASTSAPPTNCNQTSCGHNQICLPNGNCSCASGFESQSKGAQQPTDSTNTLVCLLAATMGDAAPNVLGKKDKQQSGMRITFICLIGVCAAVLLAVVTVKLMRRRQSGTLDVEATEKQHIQCEFTNEVCDSNLWVP